MKKDSFKTDVVFLLYTDAEQSPELTDLFAYFPKERYYPIGHILHNHMFNSYAHIGQHSGCHIDYAKACTIATPEQYKDLAAELESIGYNLNILTQLP